MVRHLNVCWDLKARFFCQIVFAHFATYGHCLNTTFIPSTCIYLVCGTWYVWYVVCIVYLVYIHIMVLKRSIL